LAWGQLFVKHYDVTAQIEAKISQFLDLPRPNKRGWLKSVHTLPGLARHLQASSPRKLTQLNE